MAEELIANEEERELASKPIPSLVRRYTIVTGQGMLAQIIMVVLEGLVMGWGLGAHGLACVSIIMSAEFLNLAFGNLFGTGVPAIVGNLLGAGDVKGASKAFSQGFWLTSIVSIILAVIMAVFTEPICAFFGATPDIMADTVLGVRTFSILLPFTVVGQMVTAVMRVDEKVQIQANLMTVSAIIAIVWLALSTFIFKLGTMGAGIYYGLSIGLWFVAVFYFVFSKHTKFKIAFSDMKLEGKLCKEILTIGLPTFLVQAASLLYTIVINNYLGVLGGERFDHSFASLCVLSYIADRGGRAVMADGKTRVFVISSGRLVFTDLKGATLSVFPFGVNACTVSYKGLQYPLTNYALSLNEAMGVSNCIIENRAEVFLHQGRALVILLEP